MVVHDIDGNGPVAVTLEVVPEATLFTSVTGIITEVGSEQAIRLVDAPASGASYRVEFFAGQVAVAVPRGLTVSVDDQQRPSITGTPLDAGETTVRVTELASTLGRSVAPSHELTLSVHDPADVVPPEGEPTEVPDITLERITDPAAGAAVRVGQEVLWVVRAPGAVDMSATVHREGDSDPVAWATVVQTLEDELEIDAIPTDPGEYVITVAASNTAGSVVTTFAFTVGAAPGGDSGEGGGSEVTGGGAPAKPSADPLAATGGALPNLPLMIGAGAVLLGAIVVIAATVRRSQRRN